MSNWAEYTAGTNPTNAASYLKVGDIDAGAGATITFSAVAKKTYTIEYKDGIDTVIWSRLADVASHDTDWTATVVDPQPGPNRYYRIVTPRRP
jgi:hypothetical protein